ncbi:MAG: fimbrial protein [Alistipes sp.]|nr:fimbrial protein [Alistipes sp.]
MRSKYILPALFSLAFICQWSCVREDCDITPDGEGTAEVSIEIRIPGKPFQADTRALTQADETHVEDVVILVFDNSGDFLQRADARTVETIPEESIKRFNIKLKTGQCDIWIFANCKDIIDAYTFPANATKSIIRENLLLRVAGKWNTSSTGFTPLPMWGERTGLNVTPGLSLVGAANRIQLVRSVVKVDLTIDRTAIPESDFTMQALNLHNWSAQSRIVPDEAAFGTDKTVVERISGGTESPVTDKVQSFAAAERDNDGFFTNVMHVPETPAGSASGTVNPCIVLNATYMGTPGWFKTEFLDEDVSGDLDRFLPLLRNHRFNFEIIGVEGRGYATADEAYRSKGSNLIVRLHTHDDTSLTNIMYDGQYWLAWDPDKFELYREEHPADDTDNVMQIETNCEDGWKFERVADADGQPVTWLTVPAAEQSGGKNTRARVHFVASENTGAPRTAFVHFSAGRMDMAVEVTQSDQGNVRVRILDENGAEVSGTVWLKTPQNRDILKEYTIDWLPKDASVAVISERIGQNDLLFKPGSGITAGTLQNAAGKYTYSLRLLELLEGRDYYDNNNNLRTYGNQYTFTVTDHGVTASTSFDLRHHLDMSATDIDTLGYRMGFEYDYRFFSTMSYRVTGITDPNDAEYSNEMENADVNVPDGQTDTRDYKFRLRNPNKAKDESRIGINLTFPGSDLPDTTVYIQAYYMWSNSHMARPGATVWIPVKQALRNYRHEWLDDGTLPDLSGMEPHIMWSTVNGLITSVQLVPTLNPNPDPMKSEIEVQIGNVGTGNALISLKVGGTVIWSWRIWVTNYVPGTNGNPNGTAGRGLFNYTYNEYRYVTMDRNLGALGYQPTPTTNRNRMGGMYYQGGRKDPLPYSDHIEADGSRDIKSLPVISNMTNLPVRRRPFTAYTRNPANSANYFNLRRSIQEPTTYILAPDQISGYKNPSNWVIS